MSQCLDGRIPNKQTLIAEAAARQDRRYKTNAKQIGVSPPPMLALSRSGYTPQALLVASAWWPVG
jgi:hypothetical protein